MSTKERTGHESLGELQHPCCRKECDDELVESTEVVKPAKMPSAGSFQDGQVKFPQIDPATRLAYDTNSGKDLTEHVGTSTTVC